MFGVPKHLAKMAIKRNKHLALKMAIKRHAKHHYQTSQSSISDWSNENLEKRRKKAKICNILGPKTPKMTF